MDLKLLAEPFHSSQIHWRPGMVKNNTGLALAYLDSRDVMDRLDKVCGPENWQSQHCWSDGKKLNCQIGIFVNGQWVWKSDGAGDTAVEGDKGAFSDALKRAAVSWGIGRYLYGSPGWWEPVENKRFTEAAIKSLNQKYEKWLLPGKQQKYAEAYAINEEAFLNTIEHIKKGELDIAAEWWIQITEADQAYLWLAVNAGGLLDQDTKKIIRSTDFGLEIAKARR